MSNFIQIPSVNERILLGSILPGCRLGHGVMRRSPLVIVRYPLLWSSPCHPELPTGRADPLHDKVYSPIPGNSDFYFHFRTRGLAIDTFGPELARVTIVSVVQSPLTATFLRVRQLCPISGGRFSGLWGPNRPGFCANSRVSQESKLETGLGGWGAGIRTWEWRNQNPGSSYYLSTCIPKKCGNSTSIRSRG